MPVELNPGDAAPDFTLPLDDGETITLAGLRGAKVVLYFYPKDDTTGCTSEAQQFTALAEAFASTAAVVVGVSRDSLKSHAKFRAKYGLNVMLGSDEDGKVTEDYGVWVEKSMYGRQYMGIERATFLIGADGRIARVWRKVKTPGHAAQVLDAAQAL
jgi:peroxiredoxin Q/BCP